MQSESLDGKVIPIFRTKDGLLAVESQPEIAYKVNVKLPPEYLTRVYEGHCVRYYRYSGDWFNGAPVYQEIFDRIPEDGIEANSRLASYLGNPCNPEP